MVPPESVAERERLMLMARKLYRFTTILAVPAVGLGLWIWLGWGLGSGSGWLHAKLVMVLLIIGYHHACGRILRKFDQQTMARSHVWFRWFNELPVLMLLVTVLLVVLKPF
jgi:putative membrane protein